MTEVDRISTITTGVAEEVHFRKWTISNFEMVQKNKKLVCEQKFEVKTGPNSACHSSWLIGMKLSENESHIGFYCKLEGLPGKDETEEVPVGFSINFRYQDGNRVSKSTKKTLKLEESCGFENIWTFDWPGNWSNYVETDGSLTINVTLKLFVPVSQNTATDLLEKGFQIDAVSKLQDNLTTLLYKDNCELADTKIHSSDGKEFNCHKVILSARSSYFASMFSPGAFKEGSSGVIQMDDLSGKTIELLLHYIYTGQLLKYWKEADVIVEFTYAAGKWQLTEIIELLDNVLGSVQEQVTSTTAVLLDLANKLSLKKAEAELMKRIAKFTTSVRNTEEYLAFVNE